MTDFLSDEWFEALKNLGGKSPVFEGASLSCQYEISGTPEGKVRLYMTWKEGVLSDVSKGKLDNPDCLFNMKFEHAKELFFGDGSVEEAFMRGDLKIEGDYKKFLLDLYDWRQSIGYRQLWEELESI